MKSSISPLWTQASITTLDLILDVQNPRIEVRKEAQQDEIRRVLVESEEIDDLAKNIANTDGNMAGERLIVVEENGRYVVVEGNRRACACQMLLDASLIPNTAKTRFPAIDSNTRAAIGKLAADVAPSREAAEPIITRRHTEAGIKPWNTVAKHRRIRRLMAAGRTLQAISAEFNQSVPSLRKMMREMALLDKVRRLPGWSQEEQDMFASPQLKTNPFTRFFTLEGVKGALGMKFDEDGDPCSDLNSRVFDSALRFIARQFLLPTGADNEPEANTRTVPTEIWKKLAAVDRRTATKLHLSPAVIASRRKKLKGKAAAFFESLECPIRDDQLRQLTIEISTIDYPSFPTSAAFLVRALIERCLEYAITKAGLNKEFHEGWKTKRKTSAPGDPGLDFMIGFAITHADKIFVGAVVKVLNHWLRAKKFSDMIIHGKWAKAHPATLEEFASFVRPLTQKILDGSALK
ncbi:MAG: hypothetical protein V7609_1197 [Verrucomicrobiota bacterium]